MTEKQLSEIDLTFSGKLRTVDPVLLGMDFQTLKNMEYTDRGIRMVRGMQKINPAALTYPRMRAGIQLVKNNVQESHVIVQSWNASLDAAYLYDLTTEPPGTGNFSATTLLSETGASIDIGRFGGGLHGSILFCDGNETYVWQGTEIPASAIINYAPNDEDVWVDRTSILNNLLSTDGNECNALLDADGTINFYVGFIRPLSAIKPYISQANSGTSTLSIEYHDGTSWTAVSNLVDGTSSGGVTLAQTAWAAFDDTQDLAKPLLLKGEYLYWYKFTASAGSSDLKLYHLAVKSEVQPIRDIWDGVERIVLSVLKRPSGTQYDDYTVNVQTNNYQSDLSSTYFDISGLATSGSFYVGFPVSTSAVYFEIVDGYINTAASTKMSVKYRKNGDTWTDVSGLSDGTSESGTSVVQSGFVSWDIPPSDETTRSYNNGSGLMYYRFSFDKNLTSAAGIRISYITGVPAPIYIPPYNFALAALNRTVLLGNIYGDPNEILFSAPDTISVFNGDESEKRYLGDRQSLIAGVGLYTQVGSNYYDVLLVYKHDQTWMILQSGGEVSVPIQLSSTIGLTAPQSLDSANLLAPETSREITIWQGNTGIFMFEGKGIVDLSEDIKDRFDPNSSTYLNPNMITKSVGFIDPLRWRYHWKYASGSSTTLNKELVFDIKRGKWFEVDRGSGNELQLGLKVKDFDGNSYCYGGIDSGHLMLLETGASFDGSDIDVEVQFGNLPFSKQIADEHILRVVSLIGRSANITPQVDIFVDGKSTAAKTFDLNLNADGRTIAKPVISIDAGPGTFFSPKLTLSDKTTEAAFEPFFMTLHFREMRKHLAGGN